MMSGSYTTIGMLRKAAMFCKTIVRSNEKSSVSSTGVSVPL
jgi:hypothetical protein